MRLFWEQWLAFSHRRQTLAGPFPARVSTILPFGAGVRCVFASAMSPWQLLGCMDKAKGMTRARHHLLPTFLPLTKVLLGLTYCMQLG